MYGDFSRNPFSQKYRITRVLFNQGQPLIEADLNEALYSVIENQRYIVETTLTSVKEISRTDKYSKIQGNIQSPIGGVELHCPIAIPIDYKESDSLTIAQYPFSLSYLEQRVGDKRLAHAVEMWGLRLAIGDENRIDKAQNITERLSRALSFGTLGRGHVPKVVNGTFTRKNRPIPEGWIIRVEVHSVSKENKTVTFKIDTHNAGYANKCIVEDSKLSLDGPICFVRPIHAGEFVELQTASGDFILPSKEDANLVEICSVSESEGVFTLKNEASEVKAEQCRFWMWRKSCGDLTNDEWNDYFSFKVPYDGLQAGMFWLIDASELNTVWNDGKKVPPTSENTAPVLIASQHPQFVYSTTIRSASAVSNPTTPAAAVVDPRAPAAVVHSAAIGLSSNRTASDGLPPIHLRDLPCGRLASGSSTPVIRRWLASMTLGELEGIDAEQVRSRLVRDCNLRLEDLPNLDEEIGKLVAYRDQCFGSPRSVSA